MVYGFILIAVPWALRDVRALGFAAQSQSQLRQQLLLRRTYVGLVVGFLLEAHRGYEILEEEDPPTRSSRRYHPLRKRPWLLLGGTHII